MLGSMENPDYNSEYECSDVDYEPSCVLLPEDVEYRIPDVIKNPNTLEYIKQFRAYECFYFKKLDGPINVRGSIVHRANSGRKPDRSLGELTLFAVQEYNKLKNKKLKAVALLRANFTVRGFRLNSYYLTLETSEGEVYEATVLATKGSPCHRRVGPNNRGTQKLILMRRAHFYPAQKETYAYMEF